jgi:hypothetical protein
MEILMCASCWRVQHLSEEFGAELQEWSDPTTFMASGQISASTYDIVDEGERLNA